MDGVEEWDKVGPTLKAGLVCLSHYFWDAWDEQSLAVTDSQGEIRVGRLPPPRQILGCECFLFFVFFFAPCSTPIPDLPKPAGILTGPKIN